MDKLNKAENIDIVKVPYRGGGEVVNAVLGNTTPIAVLALSNMVSQLQSGRITPLAVVAQRALAAVSRRADARAGASRRRLSDHMVRPVHPDRRAAADRREDCRDVDRIMAEPAFRKRMYTDRAVEPATERLDVFAKYIREERKLAQQIVKDPVSSQSDSRLSFGRRHPWRRPPLPSASAGSSG